MKKGLTVYSLFCLTFLTPVLMFGTKIGVLNLKAVGTTEATATVFAELFASDLTEYGYQVLNPDAMDAAVGEELACYEKGCAVEAGVKAGVEQVIFGSISQLGEKHIAQLSIVDVSTQEVIWSGSLSAKRAEDLDMVAKRLAKSIAEGKKPEETVEVGMVLEEEEKEPLRRRVFHSAGITAGFIQPIGGYAESNTLFHFGSLYWYETPNFAVEVLLYYAFSGDISEAGGKAMEACLPQISLLYILGKGEVTPFVGGGVGFGVLALADEFYDSGAEFDISVNAGGGVVFFRTYDIRLILDARYRVHMASIEHFDGPHHGIMFSIGFTYRTGKRFCCL